MTIPVSVAAIEKEAFCGCKRLRRVEFARNSELKVIGPKCFCGTMIERIGVPRSVTEIQDGTFYGCSNLKEVTFEEGSKLESIGDEVFCRCTSLESIQFPDGLGKLGAKCFSESGLVLSTSARAAGV